MGILDRVMSKVQHSALKGALCFFIAIPYSGAILVQIETVAVELADLID